MNQPTYKKIFFISPVPTHPTIAGNRTRILNMVEFYRQCGHSIDFLFLEGETHKNDVAEMRSYFGDAQYFKLKVKNKRIGNPFLRRLAKFVKLSEFWLSHAYNTKVDNFYYLNKKQLDFVKNLVTKKKYDVVFVEYIFLSKILSVLPTHILKIIDTHDVFSDRWKVFTNGGNEPEWFSTWKKEEQKALNRADIIIAIQDQEALYFKTLTHKKVINIPHLLKGVPSINNSIEFKPHLLYLASRNKLNSYAIELFIEKVFPLVTQRHPKTILYLGGGIIQYFKGTMLLPNIVLLEGLNKLEDIYAVADIVINPIEFGTGLKIKSIEAIMFHKYLITTTVGAAGLETYSGQVFLEAPIDDFAEAVMKIIEEEKIRAKIRANLKSFSEKWNDDIEQKLLDIL